MNRLNPLLLFTAILIGHSSCQVHHSQEKVPEIPLTKEIDQPVGHSYEFAHNGKEKGAQALHSLYTEQDIPATSFPKIDNEVISALKNQLKSLKYKKRRKSQKVDDLDISIAQLEQTIQILLEASENKEADLSNLLEAHQIKGQDGKGNVHFTGYFTPIMEVRKQKEGEFQYPLYAYPKNWKGKMPSRADIDGKGVLKDQGLELAYAKNPVDIYFMQVQGSGIVQYEDGSQELFAYSGNNRHSYRSIGRYMIKKG